MHVAPPTASEPWSFEQQGAIALDEVGVWVRRCGRWVPGGAQFNKPHPLSFSTPSATMVHRAAGRTPMHVFPDSRWTRPAAQTFPLRTRPRTPVLPTASAAHLVGRIRRDGPVIGRWICRDRL